MGFFSGYRLIERGKLKGCRALGGTAGAANGVGEALENRSEPQGTANRVAA